MTQIDDPHARLDALFPTHIEPKLAELEQERTDTLKFLAIIAGGFVVLQGLFALAGLEMLLFTVPVILVVAAQLMATMLRRYGDEVRQVTLPVVIEAIGDIDHTKGVAAADLDRFVEAQVVRSHGNHPEVSDVFSGAWRGVNFEMAEVVLRDVKTFGATPTKQRHYFRGLLFTIAAPAPVPARILLRGKQRLVRAAPWRARVGDGLQRVSIPHGDFNRHLELWSDEPEAALEFVTPAFADTMAGLAGSAGWYRLDAAFDDDLFLLALPRLSRRFAIGRPWRRLDRLREDTHELLDEVRVVHRLIDVLLGDADG
ncbi:MAG: DUF3137 domain-containing protein [Alphaproteobacteria bacterium]